MGQARRQVFKCPCEVHARFAALRADYNLLPAGQEARLVRYPGKLQSRAQQRRSVREGRVRHCFDGLTAIFLQLEVFLFAWPNGVPCILVALPVALQAQYRNYCRSHQGLVACTDPAIPRDTFLREPPLTKDSETSKHADN